MSEAQHGKDIAKAIPCGPGTGGQLGFQGSQAKRKGSGGAINPIDAGCIENQHRLEERPKLRGLEAAAMGRIFDERGALKHGSQSLSDLVRRRHARLR
jgi:hypothetical protein